MVGVHMSADVWVSLAYLLYYYYC